MLGVLLDYTSRLFHGTLWHLMDGWFQTGDFPLTEELEGNVYLYKELSLNVLKHFHILLCLDTEFPIMCEP